MDPGAGNLKDKSISSNKLWKAAGKPHNGPIYDQHKSDKLAYKLRVKDEMQRELNCYSNDLHEALLEKAGTDFWKCWRSKFGDKKATNYL